MKFKDLQATFDQYRLYKDRGLVRMVAASVLSNQLVGLKRKPVWIVFVAPPGGGKSDVTGTITGIQKLNEDTGEVESLCEEISDLTTASFASGMNTAMAETSMIKRMNKNGGMFVFKDFTTLLSKRSDDLAAIMSYLREIYDGKFEKKFGNGKKVSWEGKVGLIASCTTVIYHKLPELSVMGDRMMIYQIEQPNRMDVQTRIWQNEDAGIDGAEEMSVKMREYVEGVMSYIEKNREVIDAMKIDNETRLEFGEVANFTTIARSGVIWNYKKDVISFVPDPEMPTRVLRQLIAFSSGLMAMNAAEGKVGELTDNDKKLIYKVAFDSIPSTRRLVINMVGSYASATLEGIADKLGQQQEAVKIWVEELVSVGVLERYMNHGTKKHQYKIKPEFSGVLSRYENVNQTGEELVGEDSDDMDLGAF